MPDHYTYLAIDIFCISFPLLFSFYPKISFYKQWKYLWLPCLLTALFFIVWDIFFTRSGVWGFNDKYVAGLYLFSLPMEEYLFFLCIPYACVFTYYCISRFYNFDKYHLAAKLASGMLIAFLLATAVSHLSQLYTSVTFFLLSLFLILLLIKRVSYLATFYVSFLVILIPFTLSNGILTGTGIAEPVVHYNNHYNLGVRMGTIPFEDIFYGMLLLVMNVAGYEYLRKRHSAH